MNEFKSTIEIKGRVYPVTVEYIYALGTTPPAYDQRGNPGDPGCAAEIEINRIMADGMNITIIIDEKDMIRFRKEAWAHVEAQERQDW